MPRRYRRQRSQSKKPVRTRSSQSRQRRLRYEVLEDRRLLALDPLVVTSTLDTVDPGDGVTTLREAITHANSVSGTNVISFNIPTTDPGFADVDSALPGGDAAADAFVIHLLSSLPSFNDTTGGTTIDGRTQAGFGGDTNPFGPEIVLDGSLGGSIGLQVNSSDNVIFGLNVHSFSGQGIRVTGGTNNWIAGNYVGTDATGTQALGNGGGGIGLNGGSGHLVGTNADGVDDADEGNLVAGNLQSNIGAYVSNDNTIAGNTIGSDRSGTAIIPGPAVWGVWIGGGASNNVVGGSEPAARNIINGPGGGVAITGKVFFAGQEATTGNRVQGNYIGITPDGAGALGTAGVGVFITEGATGNIIGTDGDRSGDATEGNVVSGSAQHGILIRGAGTDANVVAGNLVGTNALGNVVIGNSQEGVRVGSGAKWNRIGTNGDGISDAAERNVISGNRHGVWVVNAGSDYNTVAGNYIGTDVSGTMKLGNASRGVFISTGAEHNVIGTNGDGVGDMAERNLISGNGDYGVLLGGGVSFNKVAGNYIGTDVTGALPLGNGTYSYDAGVSIGGGSKSNLIGTNGDGITDEAERNLISGNPGYGVRIQHAGTEANVVAGNYIGTDA